ncbi:histidine phosphatase family protein [soil metagenome]
MPQLIIIRHGQASYGSDHYDKLSPLGARQGEVVGQWLANCGYQPARVVTGELSRQRETADHCLNALLSSAASDEPRQPERLIDKGLDEYDNERIVHVHVPHLNTPAAMRAHVATHADPVRASREIFLAAIDRWVANESPSDYEETWPAFNQRCRQAFLDAAEGLADDAQVLVFTSGGVISSLCHDLLGLTPKAAFELNWSLANAGITVVNARKGKLRLASLNSVGHLEQARDRSLITYR